PRAFATLAPNLGHVLTVAADRHAAPATDLGHMASVSADGHAPFPAGFAGLIRSEFVRRSLPVRRLPALGGDLPLFLGGHGGESTSAGSCHDNVSFLLSLSSPQFPSRLSAYRREKGRREGRILRSAQCCRVEAVRMTGEQKEKFLKLAEKRRER